MAEYQKPYVVQKLREGSDLQHVRHVPAMDNVPLPLCHVGNAIIRTTNFRQLWLVTRQKKYSDLPVCQRCLQSATRQVKYLQ